MVTCPLRADRWSLLVVLASAARTTTAWTMAGCLGREVWKEWCIVQSGLILSKELCVTSTHTALAKLGKMTTPKRQFIRKPNYPMSPEREQARFEVTMMGHHTSFWNAAKSTMASQYLFHIILPSLSDPHGLDINGYSFTMYCLTQPLEF